MATPRSMVDQFLAARNVSTPLMAVETVDPAATLRSLSEAVIADAKARKWSEPPILHWDAAVGITPMNEPGKAAAAILINKVGGVEGTIHPAVMLVAAAELPAYTMLVAQSLTRFMEAERLDPAVVQAVWNLRDLFKRNRRTLVMTAPTCVMPTELQHDVTVFDEPMPTHDDLQSIVQRVHDSVNRDRDADTRISVPTGRTMTRVTDALAGMSSFAAEQVTSMSLTKDGINFDSLAERQKKQIEQTPGLTLYRGDNKLDNLKDMDAAVDYFRRVNNSNNPPALYCLIDEIDKMFAGAWSGDSSGTSQELYGLFLQHWNDTNARGALLFGAAGTGKTELTKSVGAEAGVPMLMVDVSAWKGQYVGQTQERTRAALKTIHAHGQGRVFFIGTCNSYEGIPMPLRRRFGSGTWFFDLPTPEAQVEMWAHYTAVNGVSGTLPPCDGWTGAEIKTCCESAAALDITLVEAAQYICPIARSNAEELRDLRRRAAGRMKSAATGEDVTPPDSDNLPQGVREFAIPERAVAEIVGMSES